MKTLILLLIPFFAFSQYISVSQDVKLATLGDSEHGYKAPTRDVLIRAGYEKGYNVFLEYENANLRPLFQRLNLNAGYTFEVKNFEITLAFGFGVIKRKENFWQFNAGVEAGYNIGKFAIIAIYEAVQRTDLIRKPIILSLFAGLKFKIS